MKRFPALTALALSACAATPGPDTAVRPAVWPGLPASEDQDEANLLAWAERYPNSSQIRRRLLAAAVARQDQGAAEDALADLAAMGTAFSANAIAQIGKGLPGLPAGWDAPFASNDSPVATSTMIAEIPGSFGLIEGVVRDPASGALYATMVTGRGLLVRGTDGSWTPLDGIARGTGEGAPPTGSLSGLALSADGRMLWMSAAVFEPTPNPARAFAGLIAYDLVARRIVRQVAAAAGANPSDLTVARDGTVYASDPLGGAVYVMRPGSQRLNTLVAPGRFGSPQGLALSVDGQRLYVSDYGWGLAAIDLATGAIVRVRATTPMTLDGIDWIGRRGGELIAVQNGTRPRRIVALRLARDGVTIDRLRVIERANPAWSEPAGAFIDGNRLLYVGDARWDEFGPGGVRKGDAPQAPIAIRAVALD